MLLPQARRATEVYQSGRPRVEDVHLLARQAVSDVVDRVPIGPAFAKPMPLHGPLQKADIVFAFHRNTVTERVERIGPPVFDIPCSVAEPLQTHEVMDRLPRDAGERHLAGEMENDDIAAVSHDRLQAISESPATTDSQTGNFPGGRSKMPQLSRVVTFPACDMFRSPIYHDESRAVAEKSPNRTGLPRPDQRGNQSND